MARTAMEHDTDSAAEGKERAAKKKKLPRRTTNTETPTSVPPRLPAYLLFFAYQTTEVARKTHRGTNRHEESVMT